MIIKKINLALILLLPQMIIPMETKEAIKADADNMISECEGLCIYTKNYTPDAMTKCFMDYGKQKEYFLIRKYTRECQHLPFDETWFFKTAIEDRVKDLSATNRAYEQWKNPNIAACAQMRLWQYEQQVQDLTKEVNRDVNTFKREHPIISGVVRAKEFASRLFSRINK